MTKLDPKLFYSQDSSAEGARTHAEELDRCLGFRVEEIEKGLLEKAQALEPDGSHRTWGQGLHAGNQTWVGLSHQTLQTPYVELVQMCELLELKAGSSLVDLGAGYGRLGLILNCLYPGTRFIGFEYVGERVKEGQRILEKFGCTQASLIERDIAAPDFVLPEVDHYFIYDYGTVSHIRHTLEELEKLSVKKNFKIIARGKGTRSLIHYEHPWLINLKTPIHQEQFSIFSTGL